MTVSSHRFITMIVGSRRHPMRDWITQHAWQITGLSAVLVVAGLAVAMMFIVRMPEDYFVRDLRAVEGRSVIRLIRRTAKNGLALLLAIVGLLLSLPMVPGPGLLMLLMALSIADFPGKRRLELLIVRNPLVLRPANALRAWCRRRPLRLPMDHVGDAR
jgi:hypothetical protein